MNRRLRWIWLAGLLTLGLAAAGVWGFHDRGLPRDAAAVHRLPRIRPDYLGTVIPPNIAPLNFVVDEPGVAFRVQVRAATGANIDIVSRNASIVIPVGPWHELLAGNRGGQVCWDVYVQDSAGSWSRFDPIENTVAEEPIDSHLAYRRLGASYYHYGHLGIYQRNLENYEEAAILRNTSLEHGCVNCHTFGHDNAPDHFSFQVRPPTGGSFGNGMIGVDHGRAFRIPTRSAAIPGISSYTAWHPRAELAAFSVNRAAQFMHGAGSEVREVCEGKGQLALVNPKTGAVWSTGGISDPQRLAAFPAWSADGKFLYFCSTPVPGSDPSTPPYPDYDQIKYDLLRIRYEVETNTWGTPEPVLTAEQTGLSITQPRCSPDGRYVLLCLCHHGIFPVLQASSDLYLLDLAQQAPANCRPLQHANSPEADAWHSWSSNSRWIVFSSKRGNGLFARPYICYIDGSGNDHKPFLLPQADPLFYDTCLQTFNVPELVRGAITVTEQELVRAILSEKADDTTETKPTPRGR